MAKIIGLLMTCAMVCCLALNSFAQSITGIIEQSTCPTLRVTGAIANCAGASVLWSSSTAGVVGYYLDTYAGRYPRGSGLLAAGTRSFLIPTGCGTGGGVTVNEVLSTGGTCSLTYTGNLPHARDCNQCSSGAFLGISVVSSASFRTYVSENSIASAFNDNSTDPSKPPFTAFPQIANSLPLPTTLGGVSVTVDDQPTGIFFVSPGQVNFYVPYGFGPGLHTVKITNQSGFVWSTSQMLCTANAVATFTQDSTGTGAAAVVWLVIRANGTQGYYSSGQRPALNPSDVVYLVTFGTGFVNSDVTLILSNGRRYGGQSYNVPGMTGLQQQNWRIGINELWNSTISGYIQVRNQDGTFDGQGVDFRAF